jgi:hypothetical protein
LRQEEWGEIKAFVTHTGEYRQNLRDTLEEIRKENKDRFEILIGQIRSDRVDEDTIAIQIAKNLAREQEKIDEGRKREQAIRDKAHQDREDRLRSLERFRWMIGGAVAIITTALIPIALAVIR